MAAGAEKLNLARQINLSGHGLHTVDDEANVFVLIDPQFLSAPNDVVPVHVLSKVFTFHLAPY